MVRVYKLTDDVMESGVYHTPTTWGENVTHEIAPELRWEQAPLCSNAWLHAYRTPEEAVLLNPMHGAFDADTMRLWEAEADEPLRDEGDGKVGTVKLTTLRQIDQPVFTDEDWGDLLAQLLYDLLPRNAQVRAWANDWLDGRIERGWTALPDLLVELEDQLFRARSAASIDRLKAAKAALSDLDNYGDDLDARDFAEAAINLLEAGADLPKAIKHLAARRAKAAAVPAAA